MDEWVLALKRGESWAYEILYKKHWKPIVYYSNSILKDEDNAVDAAQFAFMKLYEKRDKVKSEKHASNFLYLASRRKCISILREVNSKMEEITEFIEDSISEEEIIDLDWVYTQVIGIIADLPEKYQVAIFKRVKRGIQSRGALSNIEYIDISRARKKVIAEFEKRSKR